MDGVHKIKCKDSVCFLEYDIFKDDLIKYKSCNKDRANKLDEELKKKNSRTRLSFLTITSINLFCCQEKVFILMNI